MSIRDKLGTIRDFQSVVLLTALIVLVTLGILFMGLSIWANVAENSDITGLPRMPAASKAQYTIELRTTGDVLLTNDYDVAESPNNPDMLLYTLNGFYRVENDKWKYDESDIPLDEYYFGEITPNRR